MLSTETKTIGVPEIEADYVRPSDAIALTAVQAGMLAIAGLEKLDASMSFEITVKVLQ